MRSSLFRPRCRRARPDIPVPRRMPSGALPAWTTAPTDVFPTTLSQHIGHLVPAQRRRRGAGTPTTGFSDPQCGNGLPEPRLGSGLPDLPPGNG